MKLPAVAYLLDLSARIICCDLAQSLGGDYGALRCIQGMELICATLRRQVPPVVDPLTLFMPLYLKSELASFP